MSYTASELVALRSARHWVKQELLGKLSELNFFPVPPPMAAKPGEAIVAAAIATAGRLASIAPLYSSESETQLKTALASNVSLRGALLPAAKWLEVFESAWKKYRRTTIAEELFLAGLEAVRKDGTIDDEALRAMSTRFAVARKEHGFLMKDGSSPDYPMVMRFGGWAK